MDKNVLLEIYKIEAEKYNKTRDIQWRLNIAIWTVLIVAIYAKSQSEFNFNKWPITVQIAIGLIYLVVHAVFIFNIHGSMNRSLARMHNMASYIMEEKKDVPLKWIDLEFGASKPRGNWEWLQLVISIFLIMIFYMTDAAIGNLTK